jgi:hypothetical protein
MRNTEAELREREEVKVKTLRNGWREWRAPTEAELEARHYRVGHQAPSLV